MDINVAEPLSPMSVDQALDFCLQVQRTYGIALIIPGDLHLWGPNGGNKSGLFLQFLDALSYEKVLLLGDIFDGDKRERESADDRALLALLQALDTRNRVHVVCGNHDRRMLHSLSKLHEKMVTRTVGVMEVDLSWLVRERLYDDVVYAQSASHVYTKGVQNDTVFRAGVYDVLVLRVGGRHILFEHGDAYDILTKGDKKNSILTFVGKCAYDLLVPMERRHASFSSLSGTLKQRVSRWRGVCRNVAKGAILRAMSLPISVEGAVCGHTHYPEHFIHHGIHYLNVGSMRGYRPSFGIITKDGTILPPVVVRSGR